MSEWVDVELISVSSKYFWLARTHRWSNTTPSQDYLLTPELPDVARRWSHSGLKSWVRVYEEHRFGSKVGPALSLISARSFILRDCSLICSSLCAAFYGVFLLSCSVAPFCGFYLWLLSCDFFDIIYWSLSTSKNTQFFLHALHITILTTYEFALLFSSVYMFELMKSQISSHRVGKLTTYISAHQFFIDLWRVGKIIIFFATYELRRAMTNFKEKTSW